MRSLSQNTTTPMKEGQIASYLSNKEGLWMAVIDLHTIATLLSFVPFLALKVSFTTKFSRFFTWRALDCKAIALQSQQGM